MLLLLSFLFLVAGYLSIWVKKNTWIQGFFSLASLLFVIVSGEMEMLAFIPLSLLLLLTLTLNSDLTGLARYLFVTANFLVGGALFYNFLPGLPSPFSVLDTPVSYGKSFTGLILLAWLIETVKDKQTLVEACKSSFPLALSGTLLFVLITKSYTPAVSTSALLVYAFASILPEEALVRGFMQKELFTMMRGGVKGHFTCLFLSTGLSCCLHLAWVGDLSLLPLIICTSFFYSLIYQMTKKVEGGALCHLFIYLFTGVG